MFTLQFSASSVVATALCLDWLLYHLDDLGIEQLALPLPESRPMSVL